VSHFIDRFRAFNFFGGFSGWNCSWNFDGARVSGLYGFHAFNSDGTGMALAKTTLHEQQKVREHFAQR
jgi:hypothetical protein